MGISTLRQALLRIVMIAGLCATAAGCISDAAAPTADGATPMRYYGGPKSPMWASQ
ncbi:MULTISPECIES: hypothetical protein [unclassified Bradyrhizobium]